MASIIRIKRSSVSGNPGTLGVGELAYSALADTDPATPNGGDRLYIGMGSESTGNAANHVVIGGKYFTDMLDQTPGVLTASSALIVDSNSKINIINVGNIRTTGSSNTISSTNSNGNILLTPNGTGYVQISGTNGLIIPVGTSVQQGPAIAGAIRLNSTTAQFEGYSGSNWTSLGGVRSVDGLTYIIAESTPGASDDNLLFYSATGASTNIQVAALNQIKLGLLQTTVSSSTTTGALTVAGGVGISGKLFVNDISADTGSLLVTGHILPTQSNTYDLGSPSARFRTLYVSNSTLDLGGTTISANGAGAILVDKLSVTAITNSTSTSTGALTVAGGAGIDGNIWIGGTLNVTGVATHVNGTFTGTLGVTGHTTFEGVTSTGATGTGNIVYSSSPTLVTPVLGVAIATTINKVTITAPTTAATLTLVDGSSLITSGAFATTLTSTATTNVTLPVTGTLATLAGTETLTNKTISFGSNTVSMTSAQLATAVSDETGTGVVVFSNTPTLVTPVLGVAAATSINKVVFTAPATGSTLTIADGKTLTASNTLTLTGTDASSVAFSAGGTVAYIANKLSVFAATTSSELAGVISDETGTGVVVFSNTPTLVTPVLGVATATSITATSGNILINAASGDNNVNLAPTGSGTVDVGSKRITSVATPTTDTDAVNKGYVDAVKTGLNVKDAARLTTIAALTATYDNGTAGVGATLTNSGTLAALTLDSVPVVAGDRVLIKDQASAVQNGVYTVTTIGTASVAWVLTRAIDFDNNPGGEVGGGDFIFVQEGTSQSDNGYVVTTNGTVTVGTTGIDFAQFSGAGNITAGDGLTKSGNTINTVGTLNRITIAADSIDISTAYVGQATITTLGTITTGTWTAGVIAGEYGGTGVVNTGKTITLSGNLATSGAFATTLTSTATTNVTLPTTGTLATLAGTETLTNKTLTTPTLTTPTINSGASFSGSTSGTITVVATAIAGTNTLTLPAANDTLVGKATTDTLTNKTLTAPTINGGTHTAISSLGIRDTSAAHDVTIAAISSTTLTAGRTLTLDMVNAARSIKLSGNIDIANNFTTSGAFATTLTATATTNVTLPVTGTLATLDGVETLTNKTIAGVTVSAGSINNTPIGATTTNTAAFTTLTANGQVTFTGGIASTTTGTGTVVITGGLGVSGNAFYGGNITGAGPGTLAVPISVIDGFNIDCGTY